MRRLTQGWVPGDLLPGAERGTWGPTEDTLMSFPVDHDDDKCSCMRGVETGDDWEYGKAMRWAPDDEGGRDE